MSLAQMMIEEKEPADKISKYTDYAIDKSGLQGVFPTLKQMKIL